MLPQHRQPTHPGQILLHEFLNPLAITQQEFAAQLGVPLQRINEIVRGKRSVTAESAWLLAQAFGTSPEFWLNLQSAYDLAASRPLRKRPTREQIAQKIWLIRCLLKAKRIAPEQPTALEAVNGLYVIELGDTTLSFPMTDDGYAQATQVLSALDPERLDEVG